MTYNPPVDDVVLHTHDEWAAPWDGLIHCEVWETVYVNERSIETIASPSFFAVSASQEGTT